MYRIQHITLATNNGDIGGGEVMLLRVAQTLLKLEHSVSVVAPTRPGDLADAAEKAGLDTVRLAADGRKQWMLALRRWDQRRRQGVLWCNGLVPAAATIGHRNRIVHLHQRPSSRVAQVLAKLARQRTLATVVPSKYMAQHIRGAFVLPNWTEPISTVRTSAAAGPGVSDEPTVVGFLGRLSTDKGVVVLADAMEMLQQRQPGRFRLLAAGEPRFVNRKDYALVDAALDRIAAITDRPGWMDRDEFFAKIDVLAMPSRWGEPFGLGAAEAMAARVPVIATDDGALPEVVGPRGIVVQPGSPRALADAIAQFTDSRSEQETERQYARWLECFSPDVGQRNLAQFLGTLA